MSFLAEIVEYSTSLQLDIFVVSLDFFLPQASCSALIPGTSIFSGLYSHAIQNINSKLVKEVHGPGLDCVLIVCFNQRASFLAGSSNQSMKYMTNIFVLTFYSNEKGNKV